MSRTIVITGANGFLGSALCERFAAEGWAVRAGVRAPDRFRASAPGITAFRCDLPDALDETAFAGADACIHAAYVTQFRSAAQANRVNFEGTRKVVALARKQPACHYLFISSASAHAGALSIYGTSKLSLERELDLTKEAAIRPGLILGKSGLFWRMRDTVAKAPAIPLFDGGKQPFQLVTLQQVVDAMYAIIDRRLPGLFIAGSSDSITMTELMRALQADTGGRAKLISFPSGPMLAGLRIAEGIGMRLPVSSENLLGLRGAVVQDVGSTEERLGLRFLPAREALGQVLKR